MTKSEAELALAKGAKLTHRNFDFLEWMIQRGNYYYFEDGYRQLKDEFWAIRNNSSWLDDWEEFKETCNCNVNITNVFHQGNCIKCGKKVS